MSDQRNGGIGWTEETWNPIRGCSRVSEGCRNCYAEKVAHRFSGEGQPYEGLTTSGRWNGTIRVVDDHLLDPLRWKRPRRVFVNSMSDLFHESVSDEVIDRVFAVMALAEEHTFQVLTKRPQRMLRYLAMSAAARAGGWDRQDRVRLAAERTDSERAFFQDAGLTWPLPNVWLGVSVEDQASADKRIPLLLQTPAAVRFVSAEPLLGPVDLDVARSPEVGEVSDLDDSCGAPLGGVPGIDWVIVGGESGPGARRFDLHWARSIVDQCRSAGVAVFMKQIGTRPTVGGLIHASVHSKGADPSEWPEDLRVQEYPEGATA